MSTRDEFDEMAHGYATLAVRRSVAAKLRKVARDRDAELARLRAENERMRAVVEAARAHAACCALFILAEEPKT